MWADNETSLDLINVQHLVDGVAEIISTEDLLPVTIGVYGGWGQGKSSLIQMVRKRLQDEEGILCVTFNGWLFESYDDAKSALMGSILETIREERTLPAKAKEAMARLASRINWFRTMALAGKGALTIGTGGTGVLADAGLFALSAMGSDDGESTDGSADQSDQAIQTIRGFREDFLELLKQTKIKTLVVFIDELDRCLPNAVVETLEAIRLFLFVEGTAFVIGADERLVRHAVNLRFVEEGLEHDVGGEYLEKMIQIPFRVPAMGPREMKTYMNLLFTQLSTDKKDFEALVESLPAEAANAFGEIRFDYEQANELLKGCPTDLAENLVLTEQIGDVLTRGLKGNPRQLKRFLNMLLLRLKLAGHRGLHLHKRILGKLMLLEYFHPERFKELGRWAAVEGSCPEIQQMEEAAAAEKKTLVDEETAEGEAAGGDEGESDETGDEEEGEEGQEQENEDSTSKSEGLTPLQPKLREWLEEPQLLEWIQMEPQIQDIDLSPYFYITREQTGPVLSVTGDLSDAAREALKNLRSNSKSYRKTASEQVSELSQAEAAAIFRNLAEDLQRAENLPSSSDPPLASLVSLVDGRPDLGTDLVPLLRGIPPGRLPAGLPPALEPRLKDDHRPEFKSLLEGWVEAEEHNGRLALAAQQLLERLAKEG